LTELIAIKWLWLDNDMISAKRFFSRRGNTPTPTYERERSRQLADHVPPPRGAAQFADDSLPIKVPDTAAQLRRWQLAFQALSRPSPRE